MNPFRTRPVVGAVRSGRMAKVEMQGECPRCQKWLHLNEKNQLPDHADVAGLLCAGNDASPLNLAAAERRKRGRLPLSKEEVRGLGPMAPQQPGRQVLIVGFDLSDYRPVLTVMGQSHRGGEFGSHGFRTSNVGYFVASNGLRLLSDSKPGKPGWLDAVRPTLRVWGNPEHDGDEVQLPGPKAALQVVQAVVEFNAYLGAGTRDVVHYTK